MQYGSNVIAYNVALTALSTLKSMEYARNSFVLKAKVCDDWSGLLHLQDWSGID